MLVESPPPHKNHKQKRKTAFSPQTCETVTTRYKIYKGLDTNHRNQSSIDEFQ